MTSRSLARRLALGTAAALTVLPVAAAAGATNGTWQAFPGQSATYKTSVQQPINVDGTSNFKGNGKAVIPVKLSLAKGQGALTFESIGSDSSTDNDYSFLSFTPDAAFAVDDLKNLVSDYAFTLGDCHGGSLRWEVRTSSDKTLWIYYGSAPNFGAGGDGGCKDPGTGSLMNMIDTGALRYDTTNLGGTFYDTYANAKTLIGSDTIVKASLVLDSGWGGDQRLTLNSATVNDNKFTPRPASALSPTCDLPPAKIRVTKLSGDGAGTVNEPTTIQPNDNNGDFRVVDCKYMYNLATSSLSGPGRYQVEAIVDGSTPATGAATFDVR